jgi:flagellar motor switch protein FliN/FliY
MGSAATTLSILLGNKVSITTPTVTVTSMDTVRNEYPMPYLIIEVNYTKGINGSNLFAIKERDALIIADLMMGKDGSNPPAELTDLHMSAVSEAMNQMMGATATALSTMFKEKFDIAPPKVSMVDFSNKEHIAEVTAGTPDPIVKISFRMEVSSLIDSEMMQILNLDVAKELVNNLSKQNVIAAAPPPSKPAAPPPAAAVPPPMPAGPAYTPPTPRPSAPVQQVQFSPLQVQNPAVALEGNIGLLMDVPLQVTVELGRTKKLIREILDLGPGSVVELDKLAGEPVDVYVNTKLIAKGEVVVIDENFGVRITEIVNPFERIKSLQ